MRLLFVADGRSPIALNWIDYFMDQGHEVHLASTFPCSSDERLASFSFVPVAFSRAKAVSGESGRTGSVRPVRRRLWGASTLRIRTVLRQWLGPLTLTRAARCLDRIISEVEPDLIHAMRIPYEGMLTGLVRASAPILISVWGNDFTLHAAATPLMARYTRLALRRADALHTDCRRDQRLAYTWGFNSDKPVMVLPGAGGVQSELFYPKGNGYSENARKIVSQAEERNLTVINPRGFRAYVRNDTFFRAIPLVLEREPRARFLCPAMSEEPRAWRWVEELGISANVELLPSQTRTQMAELFRRSRIAVSPAEHDGTPNTLLEAMACGCLPVAGDIEPGVVDEEVLARSPVDEAEAALGVEELDPAAWRGRA